MSDIKAVQNNAAFGQPLPQQPKPAASAEAAKEEVASTPTWDGVERRKGSPDRRQAKDNRPDFLDTRHRHDRRKRKKLSVKV